MAAPPDRERDEGDEEKAEKKVHGMSEVMVAVVALMKNWRSG